jgi:hypothetical protein
MPQTISWSASRARAETRSTDIPHQADAARRSRSRAAQRIHFHSRAGDAASFDAWTRAFERGELEPTPPDRPGMTLRVI